MGVDVDLHTFVVFSYRICLWLGRFCMYTHCSVPQGSFLDQQGTCGTGAWDLHGQLQHHAALSVADSMAFDLLLTPHTGIYHWEQQE